MIKYDTDHDGGDTNSDIKKYDWGQGMNEWDDGDQKDREKGKPINKYVYPNHSRS